MFPHVFLEQLPQPRPAVEGFLSHRKDRRDCGSNGAGQPMAEATTMHQPKLCCLWMFVKKLPKQNGAQQYQFLSLHQLRDWNLLTLSFLIAHGSTVCATTSDRNRYDHVMWMAGVPVFAAAPQYISNLGFKLVPSYLLVIGRWVPDSDYCGRWAFKGTRIWNQGVRQGAKKPLPFLTPSDCCWDISHQNSPFEGWKRKRNHLTIKIVRHPSIIKKKKKKLWRFAQTPKTPWWNVSFPVAFLRHRWLQLLGRWTSYNQKVWGNDVWKARNCRVTAGIIGYYWDLNLSKHTQVWWPPNYSWDLLRSTQQYDSHRS